ncbi:class I SAM-dependent methyltransferase, partial [Streptomyces scabiei]|nr:class I SAM-dependent methyltransferase [Streptomyces scabiei]
MSAAPHPTPMPAPAPEVLGAFEAAKGFMPAGEGLALYAAAVEAGRLALPLLE